MTAPLAISSFNQGLLEFLQASPTPFHAVASIKQHLLAAGFVQLHEAERWQINSGNGYFVTRNDSSIVAFRAGTVSMAESGLRLVGAHTDSPCLRVKPEPDVASNGYTQLGVEVYGGVLLNPWFDRDLSLAGRVFYRGAEGDLQSILIDVQKPIAVVPSLAIHLDREANSNRTINAQTDITPVLAMASDEGFTLRGWLADYLVSQCGVEAGCQVLDYELSFYDCQAPSVVGLREEFIASARLDNLLSCYVGMQALLSAESSQWSVLVCNDHEEVGSMSAVGAQGPMLLDVLRRVEPDSTSLAQAMSRSLLISTDNAHGVHPNYVAKHEPNHRPLLNAGPVIKINANQRYATNAYTSSLFRLWCQQVDVAVQSFVVRNDMGCGSTIGPITAAELGVQTIDVGLPTFAMHSLRELAGRDDAYALYRVLQVFFAAPHLA